MIYFVKICTFSVYNSFLSLQFQLREDFDSKSWVQAGYLSHGRNQKEIMKATNLYIIVNQVRSNDSETVFLFSLDLLWSVSINKRSGTILYAYRFAFC